MGGFRGRPDCVRARDCVVLEFKPEGVSGDRQLGKYVPFLKSYYTREIRAGNALKTHQERVAYWNRIVGGYAFVAALIRERCWNSHSRNVVFHGKTVHYGRCDDRYQCTRGD